MLHVVAVLARAFITQRGPGGQRQRVFLPAHPVAAFVAGSQPIIWSTQPIPLISANTGDVDVQIIVPSMTPADDPGAGAVWLNYTSRPYRFATPKPINGSANTKNGGLVVAHVRSGRSSYWSGGGSSTGGATKTTYHS